MMLRKIFWILVKVIAAIGLCITAAGLLMLLVLSRTEGAGAYVLQFIGGSSIGIGAIFLAVSSAIFMFKRT